MTTDLARFTGEGIQIVVVNLIIPRVQDVLQVGSALRGGDIEEVLAKAPGGHNIICISQTGF